jgi:hypothetical protein
MSCTPNLPSELTKKLQSANGIKLKKKRFEGEFFFACNKKRKFFGLVFLQKTLLINHLPARRWQAMTRSGLVFALLLLSH